MGARPSSAAVSPANHIDSDSPSHSSGAFVPTSVRASKPVGCAPSPHDRTASTTASGDGGGTSSRSLSSTREARTTVTPIVTTHSTNVDLAASSHSSPSSTPTMGDEKFREQEKKVMETSYLADDLDLSLMYLDFMRQFFAGLKHYTTSQKASLARKVDFVESLLRSQSLLELVARHDEQLGFHRNVNDMYQNDKELALYLRTQFQPPTDSLVDKKRRSSMSFAGAARGVLFAAALSKSVVQEIDDGKEWRVLAASIGMDARKILEPFLSTIDTWDFDIWALNEATSGHAYECIGYVLLSHYGFTGDDRYAAILPFLQRTQSMYLNNPYHNSVHAADVAQTAHVFLHNGLTEGFRLRASEHLAVIAASLIHDLAHPGVNNQFLINTAHMLAIRYNDKAVLESFHVAEAFRIMREEPSCNILSCVRSDDAKGVRQLMIQCVLATDMATHFNHVADFKAQVLGPVRAAAEIPAQGKNLVLSLAVHCADVSNPVKPSNVYLPWVERVMEEFYAQGEQERDQRLPVSPFMDRANPQKAKCQLGFMEFIVGPLFACWGELLKDLSPVFEANLARNKTHFETIANAGTSQRALVAEKPRPLPAAAPGRLMPGELLAQSSHGSGLDHPHAAVDSPLSSGRARD